MGTMKFKVSLGPKVSFTTDGAGHGGWVVIEYVTRSCPLGVNSRRRARLPQTSGGR